MFKIKSSKKQILSIVALVVCLLALAILCFNKVNNKQEPIYTKLSDMLLEEDFISVNLEDDSKLDYYKITFVNEKVGEYSYTINIPKENMDIDDFSNKEDPVKYYKAIENPLSQYLINVYLAKELKIQNDAELEKLNMSVNSEENENKDGYIFTINTENREPFIYDIKLNKDCSVVISYKN